MYVWINVSMYVYVCLSIRFKTCALTSHLFICLRKGGTCADFKYVTFTKRPLYTFKYTLTDTHTSTQVALFCFYIVSFVRIMDCIQRIQGSETY